MPNWALKDAGGDNLNLWDFRQKSHVVLIYDPDAAADTFQKWSSAIEADRKQWDWLNVKFVLVKKAPKEMAPGVYAIDRYGTYISTFPVGRWNFNDLEREFIYYEAKHC